MFVGEKKKKNDNNNGECLCVSEYVLVCVCVCVNSPTYCLTCFIVTITVRSLLDGKLYASLDYESRFLGKEVIGLFANRFGKSIMAVGLSVYTAQGNNKGLDNYLPLVSGLFALMWFGASYRLTQRIPAPVLADSGTTNPDDKDKKE